MNKLRILLFNICKIIYFRLFYTHEDFLFYVIILLFLLFDKISDTFIL
jgi:hypothetical protein